MAASTPNHEPPAVRAMSPNANLAKLAAEIHIEIAEMLEDKELRVLRQVCRALAKDTRDVFAKRFFSMMTVSLDIKSLQRFVEMTNISYLAKWMKRIKLRPEPWCRIDGRKTFKRDALTQSFRNLSLLGAGKSIGTSGVWPPASDYKIIGHALADSRHVIDDLKLEWGDWMLGPALFQPIDVERMQVLFQTWAKLRVLRINPLNRFNFETMGGGFHRLFLSAFQITSLYLSMNDIGQVDQFDLRHYPILNEVFSLKHLRQLRLGGVRTNVSYMTDVVLNGRSSLKELVLSRCTIWDGHEPLLWPIVLNHIADELHLTSFQAVHLKGGDDYKGFHQGYFCDCDGSHGFKYEGSKEDIRAKIKQLAETGGHSGMWEIEHKGEDEDWWEVEDEGDDEDWWLRE